MIINKPFEPERNNSNFNNGDDALAVSRSKAVSFNKNFNLLLLAGGGSTFDEVRRTLGEDEDNSERYFSNLFGDGDNRAEAISDSEARNYILNINSNVTVY